MKNTTHQSGVVENLSINLSLDICRTTHAYSTVNWKNYWAKKVLHKKFSRDSFRQCRLAVAQLYWKSHIVAGVAKGRKSGFLS